MPDLEIVQQATGRLLSPRATRPEIIQAISRLHQTFAEITGVYANVGQAELDRESYLPQGMAVSPYLAAKCLVEVYRTRQYLLAVHAAIQEARRRFPGQSIHVLYAGCGPYATLALPMMTQFPAGSLRFTLLDIHPQSVVAVRKLVETWQLEEYVQAIVQADAITYSAPATYRPHLLVMELLQGALARESQVAATFHLVPQLRPGGLLVPKSVAVDACLANCDAENFATLVRRDADGFPVAHQEAIGQRIPLGHLLTLTQAFVKQFQNGMGPGHLPEALPAGTITIPPYPAGWEQFMLVTTINLFGSLVLANYESEVCHPVILYALNGVTPGTRLDFSYGLGRNPGFRWETREAENGPAPDYTNRI